MGCQQGMGEGPKIVGGNALLPKRKYKRAQEERKGSGEKREKQRWAEFAASYGTTPERCFAARTAGEIPAERALLSLSALSDGTAGRARSIAGGEEEKSSVRPGAFAGKQEGTADFFLP